MLLFCAFRYLSLLQGGRKVAETLGARPVLPAPEDPLERRFANVVAEMAIAAGLPMPGLYLQEQEPGINAFAAGHTLNDAVICVTRGALQALSVITSYSIHYTKLYDTGSSISTITSPLSQRLRSICSA